MQALALHWREAADGHCKSDAMLCPGLKGEHGITVMPDANPGARIIGRDARALADLLQWYNRSQHMRFVTAAG